MKASSTQETNAAQLSELEKLREEVLEISADMSSCREKESKLLEFTQKLTETNVSLQVRNQKEQFII